MSDPDLLWGEYWERFNTIRIPILGEDEYFNSAIAIVKASKDKEDFERLFEKTNKQRWEKFRSLMVNISREIDRTEESFPCQAAHLATFNACNNSCLEHFVGLLKGHVLGWEADVVESHAEPEALSDNSDVTKEISRETQKPIEEETQNPLREETQIPIEEETQGPIEEDYSYDYPLTGQIPPEWESQHDPERDWTYRTPSERKASRERYEENFVFIGTYSEYLAPTADDAAPGARDSDDEVPSLQQLPSLLLDDTSISEKEDEGKATQDVLGKHLSSPSKDENSTLTKKRVRFDDDDDDDIINHEHKRRKLENTTAHTPTSPTSPTSHASSSIQQPAGGGVSKKRSRSDDEEEDEEEDNGYKRQKIESLPSPPTSHTSPASSTEDISTSHLPSENPEKNPEEQVPETISGERKRRKQSSTSRAPRTKSSRNIPNTRSSRRAKSSTLWELDSSGKPHSV
jgi:hypothetical protein